MAKPLTACDTATASRCQKRRLTHRLWLQLLCAVHHCGRGSPPLVPLNAGCEVTCSSTDEVAFPTLEPAEVAVLDGLGSRHRVTPGDFLYRGGDAIYALYVVASGAVEITIGLAVA